MGVIDIGSGNGVCLPVEFLGMAAAHREYDQQAQDDDGKYHDNEEDRAERITVDQRLQRIL